VEKRIDGRSEKGAERKKAENELSGFQAPELSHNLKKSKKTGIRASNLRFESSLQIDVTTVPASSAKID